MHAPPRPRTEPRARGKLLKRWGSAPVLCRGMVLTVGVCCGCVLQAQMASGDKALKVLQEGIDADAQPSALLEELLKRHSNGEDLQDACKAVLKQYPAADAMLNWKHSSGGSTRSVAMPAAVATPAQKKEAAHASAPTPTHHADKDKDKHCSDAEDTVMFGAKLSATKVSRAAGDVGSTSLTTPGRSGGGANKGGEDAADAGAKTVVSTPTHCAGGMTPKPGARDETVVFGAKVTTPRTQACGGVAGRGHGQAEENRDGKEGAKKTGARAVKRTGLGKGPARRVGPGESGAVEEAGEQGGADDSVQRGGLQGLAPDAGEQDTTAAAAAAARRSTTPRQHLRDLLSASRLESMTLTSSLDLPPISEAEGRSSGEGAGSASDANLSSASAGSADSLNPSPPSHQQPRPRSEQTTQLLSAAGSGGGGGGGEEQELLAEMQTQPLGMARQGVAEQAGAHTMLGHEGGEGAAEAAAQCPVQARHEALLAGHGPVLAADDVPKGYIAVGAELYKKIEVVGKGGGGKVYKVSLKDDDTSIWAIKKIKLDDDDADLRTAVLNEIELLVGLRGQTSIIHMKDYEIGRDYVHMVMECGEQDLAQALQRRQVKSLRGVWKAMMEAVEVVHEKRVVHGDLKPANFLMVNKELKLIDFGIAKRIESNDTTNIVRDNAIGTLNYMAPEAFVGNQGSRKNNESLKLGRQSDIWSLGCILYQMVCLCSRVCVGVCRCVCACMYAGTRPQAVPCRQMDRDMHVSMYKHEYLQVYGRPPFHNLKNTIQKMQAITNREHKIEFPATGPAGNVEKDLIDVMRRTLERDPAKRPTIPELKRHPWLVPPKFGLDSYNILVMVSKVCRCRIYMHVCVCVCVCFFLVCVWGVGGAKQSRLTGCNI